MKNDRTRLSCLTMMLCVALFSNEVKSQDTEGVMSFSVRTETTGKNFSPKHVLAIWVEDADGFIKTGKLNADRRKQYLYTWNSNSSGNSTDAISGATLSSHQTHTVSWDCNDLDGNLVPDGTYTVYVEFTEEHAQGPILTVPFEKGTDVVSLTPADETNYKDIALSYDPATTGIARDEADRSNFAMTVFPNPAHDFLTLQLRDDAGKSTLKILKMNGSLVYTRELSSPGSHRINIEELRNGSYIFQVDSETQSSGQLLIKY